MSHIGQPSAKTVLRICVSDEEPVAIPTDHFSVRQMSGIWHEGTYYIYADVVDWNNPCHPNTYDSSIGVFSSPDCEHWRYHGIAVPKGHRGDWDGGGAASPGASVFGGRFYVAYSGRENPDGSGHRWMGLAVADDPLGPFDKLPEPIVAGERMLDDANLVACRADGDGPGNGLLRLYHRSNAVQWKGGKQVYDYKVHLAETTQPAGVWTSGGAVLEEPDPAFIAAKTDGHKYEPIEAKWLYDQVMLWVNDYWAEGRPGKKILVLTAADGRTFLPIEHEYLENNANFPRRKCFSPLPGIVPGSGGVWERMNRLGYVDENGHFTQWLYKITCHLSK